MQKQTESVEAETAWVDDEEKATLSVMFRSKSVTERSVLWALKNTMSQVINLMVDVCSKVHTGRMDRGPLLETEVHLNVTRF